MMFHVVAVGKMKNAALRDACDDYAKRIQHSLKVKIVEVREAGLKDDEADRARAIEASALLDAVSENTRIIVVTRSGKPMTSASLARQLDRWRREARDVALIVGGTHGMNQSLIDRADGDLSLSQMTLPHELARLVLLEQLYRACTIIKGLRYHKGS